MFWRCSSCQHRNRGRHRVCQRCKNPKDGSEQYEMPENTAAAPTVTDEALLRMATAGPNWRCAYCQSDQRALDGSCKNCGASAREGTSTAPAKAPPSTPAPPAPKPQNTRWVWYPLLVVIFGCWGPICLFELSQPKGPPVPKSWPADPKENPEEKREPEWTKTLRVKELAWSHSILVERYQKVRHEGFEEDRPADAVDVERNGTRHHHDEEVPDGYETVYDTERVRDGYDTEEYEESEECGEDCTTTPRSCEERCTSNHNGFATCDTVCTGGEKYCKPRHCSVTRKRKVPRYVEKQRARKEPRYRTVSRDAPWYVWNEWEWTYDRMVTAQGNKHETRWPTDAELRLVKNKERIDERLSSYEVIFVGKGQEEPVTYPAASLEEFQRFNVGDTYTLMKQDGKISIVRLEELAPEPAPKPSSKPKPSPKPKSSRKAAPSPKPEP
jgi:hypothetical protein